MHATLQRKIRAGDDDEEARGARTCSWLSLSEKALGMKSQFCEDIWEHIEYPKGLTRMSLARSPTASRLLTSIGGPA
jgi:hypothetical protein